MHWTRSNRAEKLFANRLDAEGKLWFWQPKTFRLGNGRKTYRPDFYIVEDQCFVEVVGTRQAYSHQRKSVELFRSTYPHLQLNVVNIAAWKKGPGKPRVEEPKCQHLPTDGLSLPAKKATSRKLAVVGCLILHTMRIGRFKTFSDVATHLGVSLCWVCAVLHGKVPSPLYTRIATEKLLAAIYDPLQPKGTAGSAGGSHANNS